jgi:hypothetical protein
VQAPPTEPFGPGVVHGVLGAAPTTGEGSVIAITRASAAAPSPRLVPTREGTMARDHRRAAVQIPTAITRVCASVKRPAPKTLTAPESQ